MATKLPPSPVGVPPGHSFWNDWYERIRTVINEGLVGVVWANINFAGSNLTDLASRAHNNLQSIQGGAAGEYNHLTNSQVMGLATAQTQIASIYNVRTKAGFPNTTDIVSGEWALYKDTTGGSVRLWTNDGGTMKSVTLV